MIEQRALTKRQSLTYLIKQLMRLVGNIDNYYTPERMMVCLRYCELAYRLAEKTQDMILKRIIDHTVHDIQQWHKQHPIP